MKQIRGMLYETPDGGIAVAIMPKGSAVMEVDVPTPWMTEPERQAIYSKARDGAHLDGYMIDWERRVGNPLSDKQKQATTLRMRLRPCENDEEVAFIEAQVARITGLERKWLRRE